MSDDDLDDFITINVTCDQAAALARLLTKAHETGFLYQVLDLHEQTKLSELSKTMVIEIQLQKTGMEK